MRILGIDFETQDDQPKTTNITEVGASLWAPKYESVTHNFFGYEKVEGISEFCWEKDYPPQSEKIIDITGITDEMLQATGRPRKWVFENKLFPLMERADVIFAHKKSFDQTILEATSERLGLTPPKKDWLCTLTEFAWPSKYTCHKLGHLAWEHGIDVKAADLHRAENDCDLMMQLTTKYYDMTDVLAYWREPWCYLKAEILGPWEGRGGDGGIQKSIATPLGFSWERCKGTEAPTWPKTWVMRTKQRNVQKVFDAVAASKSPFRVAKIQGIE